MANNIFGATDEYINELFGLHDDVMKATEQSITDADIPQISVSLNQGRFLQMMALGCRAKRILEIGTLAGFSTIWLGRGLPAGGKLVTLELEPKHADAAAANIEKAGLKDKVEIRVGDALATLKKMVAGNEEPFDLIFIDADKPPYTEYFQQSLKLSHPGTVIIADNVIKEGQVFNPENNDDPITGVRRFNAFLGNCKEVQATIIQTVGEKYHDGMAIAVVK